MAAAMVGSTAPFDSQTQTWEEYCEYVQSYLAQFSGQSDLQPNEELSQPRQARRQDV